jgi:LemA protein
MPIWFILLGIAVIVIFYIWSLYNQFVTIKTRIRASIQEIGNQLKRQAELIPNLVASVKGYMKHERAIFDELTEARKEVIKAIGEKDTQKLIDTGSRLQAALVPIRAVFESTPQLQAAGPTGKLMEELRDTVDKVMYARRTLIDLTADYNIKVVTFPSNLVAQIFGFKQEPGLRTPEEGKHLEVGKEETKAPEVEF